MQTVIDTRGKKAHVTEATYEDMRRSFYDQGVIAVLVNDIDGMPHMVALEDNFVYSEVV